MPKKKLEVEAVGTKEAAGAEEVVEVKVIESELEHLRKLYDELKSLGVNSIGDLENKIARLQ